MPPSATPPPMRFRGRKEPPNLHHLKQLSRQRNAAVLAEIRKVEAPSTWDSRTQGWVGPVKDQSQCGSCWAFSGTAVVESALYKAGILVSDGSQALSEEYTLSCGDNGGCNGDDNTNVLDWAKHHGLPLTSAYGPYAGYPQRCAYQPSMQLYKIKEWGFADGSTGQGVTPPDAIKAAIMAYGSVGAAIAADGAFENVRPGEVFEGSGSRDIDHDIVLIGWDDSKQAWILRNSWGEGWCDGGYCWIKWGANLVGTEAVFAIPPDSPSPPHPPVPTSNTVVITQSLPPGTYSITPKKS